MKKPGLKTLILIPAFNEESTVGAVIRSCRRALPEADILVINDGSSDGTASQARLAGAQVLELPYNLGIGGAVQSGYLFARRRGYEAVCQVDADGQHDPEELAKLLEELTRDQADYVVGSRFLGEGGYRSPPSRRIAISLFSWMIRAMTGRCFTDPTSGFRAAGRRAIESFAEYYPVDYPEVEALVVGHRKGFRMSETPVLMNQRQAGRSSITPVKAVYFMIKVPLALVMRATSARQVR